MQDTQVRSLSWEDPLERGMATHSSILAWRIPWTEEPGGLQSMGSQRVGHDRETSTFACSHPSEHTWREFQSSLAWRAGFASADMGTLIWPCTWVLDLLFWKERHYHTPQKGLNLQKYTIDSCFTFYHYYFVFLSVYFLYSDSLHRCKTHEFRSHAYVGKNIYIYTYDWRIIINLINV